MRELPQTCSEARSNLPLFVGGDLEAPILAGVQGHLDGCAACRAIARGLEDTRRRIGRLAGGEAVERVPDLWPGVRARLAAEGLVGAARTERSASAGVEPAATAPGAGRIFQGRFRRAGFGLGAGVAAAALLGMVLLNRADPTTVTPGTTRGPALVELDGAGIREGGVQALPIGAPAPGAPALAAGPANGLAQNDLASADLATGGALQRVPVGEKSLLELQAELDEAARAAHPSFLLLRPGQVQPAGYVRPAGHDRIK